MRATTARLSLAFLLTFILAIAGSVIAVKQHDFKKCHQSSFCRRNRQLADRAAEVPEWNAPYALDPASISVDSGVLTGAVLKSINGGAETVELPLTVSFLASGVARVTLDEKKRQLGEIELNNDRIRKERYNEAEKWSIVGGLDADSSIDSSAIFANDEVTVVKYGPAKNFEAVITHSPFSLKFIRDGEEQVVLNDRGLINMEHWRPRDSTPEEGVDQDGLFDESFSGKSDTKPRGPESVGLDISFIGYDHVFGIPEHASPLSLRETRGGGDGAYDEPYRLYNLDVFEYEFDSPMSLYGAIPFMQAHKKGGDVAVFWLNGAETWIDVVKKRAEKTTTQTHWFSESGLLDVFVFLGPTAEENIKSYSQLTGTTALPQTFSIAYHQCRWNYLSQDDVAQVDAKFDEHDIPYDVIWLDVEHTDGKRYLTWDEANFPEPEKMLEALDKKQRKLVNIVDPHIKKDDDYHVYQGAKANDVIVKDNNGNNYEGWCWPGSSVWVDFFKPKAVDWWKSLMTYDAYKGSAKNLYVWNDMNEPAVFSGPEITMPKDNIHEGGWEHRDIHNINGMVFHNATALALMNRDGDKPLRPFVLTRSFFAGTQRISASWTGDNLGNWEHLAVSIPMVLSNGIAGMTFTGADVGGFFGNPSPELLARWYQVGAFYPFFRAHAHIDTKRREPWLAGEPWTGYMKEAIRGRYRLLPTWYTAFRRASVDGMPVLRPMYLAFPDVEEGFGIDDQFFLGDSGILAKPVTKEGVDSVSVWLGDEQPYYDYSNYDVHQGKGQTIVYAPIDKTPMLIQGGNIFVRRDRSRRSSPAMKYDPFTLIVALDKDGNAKGRFYLDDGETFDYNGGAYVERTFTFDGKKGTLRSDSLNDPVPAEYLKNMERVRVEKVIIVGANGQQLGDVHAVDVLQGGKKWETEVEYVKSGDGKARVLTVRDPAVRITEDWTLQLRVGKNEL
ncbi:glucosidase II [Saitoella coloradoensis]